MNIKKLYLPLIILISGALTLTSCKKKGCTDPNASNYESSAEKDDGSCSYLNSETNTTQDPDPDPDPDPNSDPTEPFTALVDGDEFLDELTSGSVDSTQTLTIRGLKLIGSFIKIKMPATITPGTYSFLDPMDEILSAYYNDVNNTYAAASGTGSLTIVSHDPSAQTISGYFNFPATPYPGSSGNNSYTITEGEFVTTYY